MSNIIFIDFSPHKETSEETGEDNEIRKILIEHLKNYQKLYNIDKKFKENFVKTEKNKTTPKTQKPKLKGIDAKTTILSAFIIGTLFLLYTIVSR